MSRHIVIYFAVLLTGCGYTTSRNTAKETSASSLFEMSALPTGAATFAERCAQPGVVKCVGFDSAADLGDPTGDNYGKNSGIMMNAGQENPVLPVIDSSQKASGNGSLKFTIPSLSGSG